MTFIFFNVVTEKSWEGTEYEIALKWNGEDQDSAEVFIMLIVGQFLFSWISLVYI